MSLHERHFPETRFGGFSHIDGTVAFFLRINALLQPSSVVLDVGCGRGEYADDPVPLRRSLRILRGKVAHVVGIDVDPQAACNPFIDSFHTIAAGPWPIGDDSVDLVVCDNVLEHVVDPPVFFAEIRRVLRPGGILALRTSNRLSYVGVCATVIPNRYHARVTSAVQENRREEDVFPTLYRCNTVGRVHRALRSHGFDAAVSGFEAEPAYLSFSRIAYALGVLHQKLAPGIFKHAIFAFARKLTP